MADDIEQPDTDEDQADEEGVSTADMLAAKGLPPGVGAEPLPTHKSDLVNLVMQKPYRVPSYEAWAMTVPELTALLKES